MSNTMMDPEEHASKLPGWQKWAQEHGVVVPPAFRYNFTPNTETSRTAAAVAAERERCAKILSDYADARAYDPEEHDDLMEVVSKIRSDQ